jgi:hypothetical protein
LSFEKEKTGKVRCKSDLPNETDLTETSRAKKKRAEGPEVGNALRSVYQRTVDEDIPPEMLDLLVGRTCE